MQRRAFYPAPISLRDLAESLGVATLRTVVEALPGLVSIKPKQNERWRFVRDHCFVIGYSGSVVVSGADAGQMRELADRIRLAAQPSADQQEEARNAADVAILLITHQIGNRWDGEPDADHLADLLAQWSALDPLARSIAYRHIAERFTDVPSLKWYRNTIQALLCAYDLGIKAGLDTRPLADEALWQIAA